MNLQKLAKVLALAGSDNDAEALHALRTARRLLESDGGDFLTLANRITGSEGGPQSAQDWEDTIAHLRAENRRLWTDNQRLQAPQPPPPVSLAQAAEDAAIAIRLRSRVAELTAQLDDCQWEMARLRAENESLVAQAKTGEATTKPRLRRGMAGSAGKSGGQYPLF